MPKKSPEEWGYNEYTRQMELRKTYSLDAAKKQAYEQCDKKYSLKEESDKCKKGVALRYVGIFKRMEREIGKKFDNYLHDQYDPTNYETVLDQAKQIKIVIDKMYPQNQ